MNNKPIIKRTFALIALLASALAAQPASRWTYWTTGNKQSVYYLDYSTLRYRDGQAGPRDYASIWVKSTEESGYFLDHIELHYSTREFRILARVDYDANGEVRRVEGKGFDTPAPWREIPPDSIVEALIPKLWK